MAKIFILLISFLTLLSSCSKLNIKGPVQKKKNFRVLWAKNYDGEYQTGNLPIALSSPLIHDGIVYAGNNKDAMNAYQLRDGRLLWKKNEKGGLHATPIVYKDILIYGTNQGRVSARHALSGKTEYQVDLDAAIESQGVIYKGRLFFQTRNHKIFCLDALTGKILWSYKRSVPFLTTLQRVSRPLITGGKVFVGFADGHLVSFSFEDGVVLWERKLSTGSKFIDVDLSPVLFNGKLLAASMDGGLVILNPQTGQLLRRLGYAVTRKPIIYKGQLIFGTMDGELIQLDSYFSKVKKAFIDKSGISSIALWNDNLVVTTFGRKIYYIDSFSFREKENFSLGSHYSAVFGNVQIQEDYLALMSSRNRLYIFKN